MTRPRIALAFLAWTGLSWAAHAQPADRTDKEFTGTVVTADAFQLVLRADNGALVGFAIEDPAGVPAGLAPGTRVTVGYEATPGAANRLVSVKIASRPFESGSTTDPPAASPSVPAPGVESPYAPSTTTPPETRPNTAQEAPQDAQRVPPDVTGAAPPAANVEPAAGELAQPIAAGSRSGPRESAPSPLPALREVATLAALLIVASLLLWATSLRR